MNETTLTWLYFPTALVLGALHALEPGHAKTLTASYLIGIKGRKRDALLLGLSVAVTHSGVVVAICAATLWLGRETLNEDWLRDLQVFSGIAVIVLGSWMLFRRLRNRKKVLRTAQLKPITASPLVQARPHQHNSNDDCGHDHGHSHDYIPQAPQAERPTPWQIVAFGAAGGMVPCPAAITVLLMSVSLGKFGLGLFSVLGFSLGLAVTLVGFGLAVVVGLRKIDSSLHINWISRNAGVLSAGVVILSGVAALLMVH